MDRKSPRRVPTQARARATVDAILLATDALVRESGVESILMADVAKRAGVSVGTLYQYFGQPDQLLAAWEESRFKRIAEEIGERLAKFMSEPPEPHLSIGEVVALGFDRILAHMKLFRQANKAELVSRVTARTRISDDVAERVGKIFASGPYRDRWRDRDRTTAARIVIVTVAWNAYDAYAAERDDNAVARIRTELCHLMVAYLLKDAPA